MDEKKLLEQLKNDDRLALAALWQASSKNVLNLAFQMLKDSDKAEDVLMDIFVSIPQKVKSFRGDSAIATWLYRLTVNECLMRIRKSKRRGELEEEHLFSIIDETLSHDNPELSFDGALLQKALGALPAETRSMLWLKDAEEHSIEDLVDVFDMPSGTIKARLSRARAFLRTYLKEKLNYG